MVNFAMGTLLGAALLGMLPNALEALPSRTAMSVVLATFVGFFILESIVLWRHCHDSRCPVHSTGGVLILVGDALHNFVDGLVIASAFLTSTSVGITASLAVIAHEIPQEAGDFAILLQSGYTRRKALILNTLSASTTFIGAAAAYFGINVLRSASPYVLCVSAASFLYIALADLIPGRRGGKKIATLVVELALIGAGVATIAILRIHP